MEVTASCIPVLASSRVGIAALKDAICGTAMASIRYGAPVLNACSSLPCGQCALCSSGVVDRVDRSHPCTSAHPTGRDVGQHLVVRPAESLLERDRGQDGRPSQRELR